MSWWKWGLCNLQHHKNRYKQTIIIPALSITLTLIFLDEAASNLFLLLLIYSRAVAIILPYHFLAGWILHFNFMYINNMDIVVLKHCVRMEWKYNGKVETYALGMIWTCYYSFHRFLLITDITKIQIESWHI